MSWPPLIVVAFLFLSSTFQLQANESVQRVLIVNSYHLGMPWTDQQVTGIRQVLDGRSQGTEIYVEHLDAKRIVDKHYLDTLGLLLAQKYRGMQFDAIVSTDNDAFDFIKSYRDGLFGGIPAVFSGVNFFHDSMLADFPRVSGVAETFDGDGTIALMQRLHPNAKRIVVVVDETKTGRLLRKELESIERTESDGLQMEFWDQYSLPELQQRLPRLDESDLVLLMPFARDSEGRYVTFAEIARQVSHLAGVPVYGTWDFFLGHGIVGGKLTTAAAQGRAAGKILVRVLNGEDIDAIPVQRVKATGYQFDKRQLRHHGIPERSLPENSRIFFRSWLDGNRYPLGAATVLSILVLLLLWAWLRKVREKRRVVQQLQQSEERFRHLFEISPDPVWIIGGKRFIDCNQAAVSLLGYPDKQALIDVHPADLSPEMQPDGQRSEEKAEEMIALANENGLNRFEWMHKKADTTTFWAEVTLSPVVLQEGPAIYCVWRDISHRKEAEVFMQHHAEMLEQQVVERTGELQQAMLAVEQANAEKSRFLANMSHELRTPMHAILSFTQLGLKHAEKPKVRRFLSNIKSSGERLTLLLNDLLDLSKLESGQVSLNAAIGPIERVIASAIAELQGLATEKSIAFIFDPDKAHSGYFEAAMMTRVFINLLSNAIRFSPDGSTISINVRHVEHQANGVSGKALRISVTDSGMGIPTDQLESVFDKFVQSDITRSPTGGTGLGLSICKEIIELHRGAIQAESPPAGQPVGTAVHVTLPTVPPAAGHLDVIRAVKSHKSWCDMVEDIIQDQGIATRLPGSAVANENICPLGKWLSEACDSTGFDNANLLEINNAHREVHQLAARMIEMHVGGDKAKAVNMLGNLRAASGRLVERLTAQN